MKLQVRAYARSFKTPLQTHHGEWSVRRGLILRLESEHGLGWGEVAPITAFGTECYESALEFCQSLPEQITLAEIQQIPAPYPACRFGLESAWEGGLRWPPKSPIYGRFSEFPAQRGQPPKSPNSGGLAEPFPAQSPPELGDLGGKKMPALLLPTGAAALESPILLGDQSRTYTRTYKWKIGAAPIQQELEIFEELVSLLPPGAKLRLDANGGLTWQAACTWLQVCDGYGIEFLEQPLPPDQLALMLKLSQRYQTPIALDESVTNLAQLKNCYAQGWRGIFVIKAPLAGSPVELREFCQAQRLDLVWSSVFETRIARQYINDYLIAALPASNRAIGFGVDHWFTDGWERRSPEQIWERLA